MCSQRTTGRFVWCEQTGEQSFRKAFLKSCIEKGFSKSAPKLWCFSGHVWKFQNRPGGYCGEPQDIWQWGILGFYAVQAVCFNGWFAFPRWLWRESTLMWDNIDTWKNNTGFGAESAEQQLWLGWSQTGIIMSWANHKLYWWSRQGKENLFLGLLWNKEGFWKDKNFITHHLLNVFKVSAPLVFSYLSYLVVQNTWFQRVKILQAFKFLLGAWECCDPPSVCPSL